MAALRAAHDAFAACDVDLLTRPNWSPLLDEYEALPAAADPVASAAGPAAGRDHPKELGAKSGTRCRHPVALSPGEAGRGGWHEAADLRRAL